MTLPILVDCDGVLSDMTGSVLQLAREKAQVFDKGPEDVTDWDYGKSLGWPGAGDAITQAVLFREFCYRMHPYPGAFEFLRALEAEHGAQNVFICTAPWNAEWASQRYAWLAEFARIPQKRVIMASAKSLVLGRLLDDSPATLRTRPNCVCFNQPWNRAVYLPGVPRVDDYAQALEALRATNEPG